MRPRWIKTEIILLIHLMYLDEFREWVIRVRLINRLQSSCVFTLGRILKFDRPAILPRRIIRLTRLKTVIAVLLI